MNIKKILLTAIATITISISSNAQTFVSAFDSNIRYTGRYSIVSGKYIRFGYPGFQIRTVFQGSSLKMKMKPNSGYYMVEIDNQQPHKILFSETDSVTTIAEGLNNGEHNATITFITEGLKHRPQFWGFILDDGCRLPSVPRMPKHRMEFIGNSITCGFGNEGRSATEKFSYSTQNQYYTYEAITCRNLDSECLVVARSGIGIYRNCGGNLAGDKIIMPTVYPYTIYGTQGEKWDFSKYTPEVVCINLGTNDTSSPKYNHEKFLSSYYNFYKTLRSNYPKAKIVILSGTMIRKGSSREKILNELLDKVKEKANNDGDNEVYRFDMTPEDGSCPWGSCYHPSIMRHEIMAKELTAFIKSITNWQ